MRCLRRSAFLLIALVLASLGVAIAAGSDDADADGEHALTVAEQRWLTAHPVLRVGVDRDFAPYESIDRHGKLVGMAADYLRLLEKRWDVRFEVVADRTWAEILGMARRGEIDLLSSVAHTPGRAAFLSFARPYRFSTAIIVDNGDGGFLGSLANLYGKRVAVEKGYFMQELLRRDHSEITLVEAADTKQAMQFVVDGKADAYVGDAAVANQTIKRFGLVSLRFSGQTEYPSEHGFAATKAHPELAAILQKTMLSVPAHESDDINDRWLGLKVEPSVRIVTVVQYGAALSLVLLVLAVWALILRREVATRQKAEQALSETIHKLRESEALYRQLTEKVRDVVWKVDADMRITYISPADERLRGYRADEVIGHHIFDMFCEESLPAIADLIRKRRVAEAQGIETGVSTFDALHRCKDGRTLWGESFATPDRDARGALVGFHGITREITERKHMEKQVRQFAFHDSLTELPNRRLLTDRLGQALLASQRSGRYGALLFLDLDNFKPLNDAHGHAVGDLLLVEVAQRLKQCMRESDTVARFGGDEFVVIVSELGEHHDESLRQAGKVAEKVRASLAEPYLLRLAQAAKEGTVLEHRCTASVGVVLFCGDAASLESLIKAADVAMYDAKEAGRNLIRFGR